MMRKLILLVVCSFFTHTTFAQIERQQKIQKYEERQSLTRGSNTIHNYNNGYNDGLWRNRYRTPYYYNPYHLGYYPYWNPNRRWGNREYIITTDNDLVSRNTSKPTRLSLGVIVESDIVQNQFSPYIIIGGETFMIMQFHMTLPLIYPYYDNITSWEVQSWGDESAGTMQTKGDFSIGVGRTVNRISPFIALGITSRNIYDAYYDNTFILSGPLKNGIYLINRRRQVNMGIRFGMVYQWEYFELLGQIRYDGIFGGGVGIGLKL